MCCCFAARAADEPDSQTNLRWKCVPGCIMWCRAVTQVAKPLGIGGIPTQAKHTDLRLFCSSCGYHARVPEKSPIELHSRLHYVISFCTHKLWNRKTIRRISLSLSLSLSLYIYIYIRHLRVEHKQCFLVNDCCGIIVTPIRMGVGRGDTWNTSCWQPS